MSIEQSSSTRSWQAVQRTRVLGLRHDMEVLLG